MTVDSIVAALRAIRDSVPKPDSPWRVVRYSNAIAIERKVGKLGHYYIEVQNSGPAQDEPEYVFTEAEAIAVRDALNGLGGDREERILQRTAEILIAAHNTASGRDCAWVETLARLAQEGRNESRVEPLS